MRKMGLKEQIRQYRNFIILAGLAMGLIFALDATKLYEIGFSGMDWYIYGICMALIGFAAFVYYDVFMKAKPKMPQRNPPQRFVQGQPQRPAQINRLEDISAPPEMPPEMYT